ncbi:hypothetical protein GKE82_03710 [Conexibacter sp. W3-3-2]|uniref:hypothetical protein n=1 Tax=Conexibacter sp. W3-3-2 TaxID=2675227 RepID=UPI0012B88C5C|nr:hypothetical protein [Conexibacter sp. W3-3-2]MTD43431.1 hypothetical protein [Conexibacter sp. W3-3-2]
MFRDLARDGGKSRRARSGQHPRGAEIMAAHAARVRSRETHEQRVARLQAEADAYKSAEAAARADDAESTDGLR